MAKLLALAVTVLCVFSLTGFGECFTSSRHRSAQRSSIVDDAVVFPDVFHDIQSGRRHDHAPRGNRQKYNVTTRFSPMMQMPLDLARKLSESNDFDDFLEQNIENSRQIYNDLSAINGASIASRFGSNNPKPLIPKGAPCMPDMTVVPLDYEGIQDPTAFHMPTCTRVPRCGGCCNHNLISCQPSITKMVTYQILQLKQKPNGATYKGYLNVTVEEHLKCKCLCIVKKEDCPIQKRYVEQECRCVCPDPDLEKKCHNSGRFWDSDTCSCRCADVQNCTTGTFFDENTCSCRR